MVVTLPVEHFYTATLSKHIEYAIDSDLNTQEFLEQQKRVYEDIFLGQHTISFH